MNTIEIVLIVWDDEENFIKETTQSQLGFSKSKQGVYKKVIRVDEDNFENIFESLNEVEKFIFICHVSHTKEFESYFSFKNSHINKAYSNLLINYVSKGNSGLVMQKLHDDFDIQEKIISYQNLKDSIKGDDIKYQLKKEMSLVLNPVDNKLPLLSKYPNVDFTILTALVEEQKPFTQQLLKESKTEIDNYIFGIIDNSVYKEKIAFSNQTKMGMVDAAIYSYRILQDLNPRVLFMSGVCGGREKEVNIYDLIIPHNSIDIATGVYENGNFTHRLNSSSVNIGFHDFVKRITKQDSFIKNDMYNLIPSQSKYDRERQIISSSKFKIHHHEIACGTFVLKTEGVLENNYSKKINDNIVGLEMESYGVLRAAEIFDNPKQYALVVKSVMDYTNEKKSDNSVNIDGIPQGENIKEIASYISSLCVRALIPHIDIFLNNKH